MTQSKDARRVVISGTGLYTPQQTISNAELVKSFNTYVDNFNAENRAAIEAGTLEALSHSSEEFIVKASGIESRYVIDKTGVLDPARLCPRIPERADEEPSIQCEIAVAAARDALAQARKTVDEVDAVIVACSNLQRAYPAMAIEVQNALGIKGFGFDMNVACSSATFGLQCARDAVLTGSARCVLVLNPEICSGHLAWQDRDCHFIFGDVCTALVVERVETCKNPDAWEILGTRLQTQFSNNIRNNFGFLNRGDESGVGKADKLFVQNGQKVYREVSPLVAKTITEHLGKLGLNVEDVKRYWLHQANENMNQFILKMILGKDTERERAPIILDEYANTSSAGSIIAFHKHSKDLLDGDLGVICSFGAGYSIGSIIVKKVS